MAQTSKKTIYRSKKGHQFRLFYDQETFSWYAQMTESPYLCTANRHEMSCAYEDGCKDRFMSWEQYRESEAFR